METLFTPVFAIGNETSAQILPHTQEDLAQLEKQKKNI